MRAPFLVGTIVLMHVVVISAVMCIQGCGTTAMTSSQTVEPPPAPVMPPASDVMTAPLPRPQPRLTMQPPVGIEPASSKVSTENVYTVQPGDMLSKIAVRVGVSTRELMELNKLKDANHLRVGQKLILPDYAKHVPAPAAAAPAPRVTAAKPAATAGTHVVQAGDSLSKIASQYGVTMKALVEENKISDPNKVRIGQKLVIPGAKPAKVAEPASAPALMAPADASPLAEPVEPKKRASAKAKAEEPSTLAPLPQAPAPQAPAPMAPDAALASQDQPIDYVVQNNDTVESIARLFIVSKEDILRANNMAAGEEVKPNQKIKIPSSAP